MWKKLSNPSKRKTSFSKRNESIEKLYNRFAEDYGRAMTVKDMKFLSSVYIERPAMLRQVGVVRGKKLLDVGCGTGENLKKYVRKGALCAGIDISREMLKIAGEHLPEVEMKKCDIRKKLPFDDDTFDIVTMSLVIDHLEDIRNPLSDIRRVLREGGRLIISDRMEEKDRKITTEFLPGMRHTSYRRTTRTVVRGLYEHGFMIKDIRSCLPVSIPAARGL